MRQLMPLCREISGPADLETFYQLPPRLEHLRANFVATLDGVVEVSGRSGPLGNDADRAAFMAMRAVADVVMAGAGTVRAERYGPVRLDEGARGRRLGRDQPDLPPLAIVTARGDLDPKSRVFSGDHRPIILTTQSVVERRRDVAEVADVIVCGDAFVDLRRARQELSARGLHRVLCEGGPELFRSLLNNDLVDELCLSLAPMLAGSEHRHLTAEAPLPQLAEFRLEGLIEGEGILMGRYATLRTA
jgi:riboflavin biosynthesis pyrimidine reductase